MFTDLNFSYFYTFISIRIPSWKSLKSNMRGNESKNMGNSVGERFYFPGLLPDTKNRLFRYSLKNKKAILTVKLALTKIDL